MPGGSNAVIMGNGYFSGIRDLRSVQILLALFLFPFCFMMNILPWLSKIQHTLYIQTFDGYFSTYRSFSQLSALYVNRI